MTRGAKAKFDDFISLVGSSTRMRCTSRPSSAQYETLLSGSQSTHAPIAAVTKYLNGHSDVLAGCLSTNAINDRWSAIIEHRNLTGGVLGAMEAWLLIRGLRTLPLRYRAASSNALATIKGVAAAINAAAAGLRCAMLGRLHLAPTEMVRMPDT